MLTQSGFSVFGKYLMFSNLAKIKFIALLTLLIISPLATLAQTTTRASGDWSTSTNWTEGVPSGGDATVSHSMTLDASISSSSGTITISAPVTDPVDGTTYDLNINGSGTVDVKANFTIGGILNMDVGGTIIVRNGDTLTVGEPGGSLTSTFNQHPDLTVEAGGVLIFNGNVDANQTSAWTINGELIINGNYNSSNSADISGSGIMYTTGQIISNNSSLVFGSNNDCTTGPCSGNSLCATNTATPSSQFICSGQTPTSLTGSNAGSGFTYQWQIGTFSASGTFTDISGATNQGYSPGSLTATTWFRRIATNSATCSSPSISAPAKVNVITGPASVSISANGTNICSGSDVIFTATPTNGASAPTYQWYLNSSSVSGATNNTYTLTNITSSKTIYCIMTSSLACVSGSPATSNTITISIIAGGGTWGGGTDTDWKTNSNWCSGSMPISTTSVVINSGVLNMPTVSSSTTADANDLTINSGVTLIVNNILNVNGNLVINSGGKLVISSGAVVNAKKSVTNNGIISGSGTITLNNSPATAQVISGSGSYGSIFELNNTAGASLSGAVTISGTLILTAGTLTSGGNLTIDLSTGAIAYASSNTGSISGNINVSQNLTTYKYHYISTPFLSGSTVADWNDDVTIGSGTYANLYYYDETVVSPVSTNGWTSITSTSTALSPLKGYALYFSSPKVIDMTGSYTHGAAPANVTLTNTTSSDVTSDGWNLVGNPYPSPIDWSAGSGWTKTGIDNAIYCWDAPNSRYTTFVSGTGTNGGSRYLAPMQGFLVKVTSAGSQSFGCTNVVRVTGVTNTLFKMAAINDELRLTASVGAYSDETVIKLMDIATDIFDTSFDAYKLMNDNNTPSLFTKTSDDKYSINSISDTTTETTIPLHLKPGTNGVYTIYAQDIADFNSFYDVILEDTVLDISQDLRTNPAYTCTATTTDSTARFLVHLRKSNVTAINQPVLSNVIIRGIDNNVNIDFLNSSSTVGYIGVFNTIGMKVAEISYADISSGNYQITLPGEVGIYIVKVAVGDNVFTKKVFLR